MVWRGRGSLWVRSASAAAAARFNKNARKSAADRPFDLVDFPVYFGLFIFCEKMNVGGLTPSNPEAHSIRSVA